MFLRNHKKFFGILALCLSLLSMISCSEQEETNDFSNWKSRNTTFIDSIANVAKLNADGKWVIQKAYNLGEAISIGSSANSYFIYIHKIEDGTGSESPLFNDSVRIHYCGRLIHTDIYPEGFVFSKSYSTNTLNEATDVPALMGVNQGTTGFSTALMYMKEGDRWMVYIPAYLGYGTEDNSDANIPASSTLIFDIKLAKIYKYGKDKNTAWH